MDLKGPTLMLTERPSYIWSGETFIKVRSRKVWELLGYVASSENNIVDRDAVARALWCDSELARARQNLRQTLQYLSKGLPGSDQWLLVSRTTLGLDRSKLEITICKDEFFAKFGTEWGEVRHVEAATEDDNQINIPFQRLDRETRRTALIGMAPAMMNLGHFLEGIQEIAELRKHGEFSQDFGLAICEAEMRTAARQVTEAQQILKQFRNHSEASKPKNLVRMRSLEGSCSFYRGNFAKSRSESFESLKAGAASGNTRYASRSLYNSICASYYMGEVETANLILQRGLRHTANEVTGSWKLLFKFMRAYMDSETSQNVAIRANLHELKGQFQRDSQHGINGIFLARVGHLLLRSGEVKEAEPLYREALHRMSGTDCYQETAEIHSYLGELCANREDHEGAFKSHSSAVKLRRPLSSPIGLATSLRGAGIAASELGKTDEALELLEEASSLFGGIKDQFGVASSNLSIARTYRKMGKLSEAKGLFLTAMNQMEKSYEKTPRIVRSAEFETLEAFREEYLAMQ